MNILCQICFVTGNRLLLPNKDEIVKSSPSKRSTPVKKGQEGLVMYKGAMVDIASVLQRSEKSEKTRAQLESKLKELQDDMGKNIFQLFFDSRGRIGGGKGSSSIVRCVILGGFFVSSLFVKNRRQHRIKSSFLALICR